MSELLYDASGGVQDLGAAALRRARAVDLVVLPLQVRGTNCGNCRHFREHEQVRIDNSEVIEGPCVHPRVDQQVTSAMCCALWDAPGTKRLWKNE